MDLSKIRGDYLQVRDKLIGKDRTILSPNQDTSDFINTDRSDISTLVYNSYKTIDTLAMYARDKLDSVINKLMKLSVFELCDSNIRNDLYLKRLMNLNTNEKDITLNALGVDVPLNGDSRTITNSALSPSYASGHNYKDNFVKKISSDDGVGRTQSSHMNSVYKEVDNHYPDDDGTGNVNESGVKFEKWEASNKESLLYKTKTLYRQHKINTIISRFHTDPNTPKSDLDSATEYGLSHGRNLLTSKAESHNGTDNYNGYDDPYCRVWTHHHQYDRLDRLIRPFVTVDEKGETTVTKKGDFHNWSNFRMTNEGTDKDKESTLNWGWKYYNDAWKYSVLGDNGFVNITPKFVNGGKTNIHTKQCMFAIENLAWRDYDPYSFEKALSWEQRGPMGGRIMWFPPYGISFNETTTANWQSNTFIGRGEDVYSYVNTKRTGTLNFMLVVDHPSVNDYVSFYEDNVGKVKDTDILRFQAGCDSSGASLKKDNKTFKELQNIQNLSFDVTGKIDNDSLFKTKKQNNGFTEYAQPTPLTDEYIGNENQTIAVTKKELPKPVEEEIINEPSDRTITFYVFYPNNYSGHYDDLNDNNETHVNPIAYLLFGKGAQMTKDNKLTKNLPLFLNNTFNNFGKGYEMKDDFGITDDNIDDSNWIFGMDKDKNGNYHKVSNRKWYYRIDGNYEMKEDPIDSNCYNQKLTVDKNYKDTSSFNLNNDINSIPFSEVQNYLNDASNDKMDLKCTLAEMALAMPNIKEEVKEVIKKRMSNCNEERIKDIEEVLTNYTLKSIRSEGYSNAHGFNNNKGINQNRNFNLAQQRAKTPVNWIKKMLKTNIDDKHTEIFPQDKYDTKYVSMTIDGQTDDENKSIKIEQDINTKNAKQWRCAKVILSFGTSETKELDKTNQKIENAAEPIDNSEFIGFSKHNDPNEGVYYINENENRKEYKGRHWIYDEKTQQMILKNIDGIENRSQYKNFTDKDNSNDGADRRNRVRYDQEYHFFRILKQKDPIVFDKLMQKLQYFNPAYHSMTPEGFNARLTFLQQCTRQGDTTTATDRNVTSANNLAFGRPPFCILRLGDFYNQMIVIDNISINYDPLVWDLNTEGIGVQPLIANVSISFTFIGGGSMTGPVQRLQNAMSFNYYANVNLYDNRSDRPYYNWDNKTNGALDHSLDKSKSYFHTVQTYNDL